MIALVDNEKVIIENGFKIENGFRVARYNINYKPYYENENQKIITSGHVFILNYNEATFIPSPPMTFDEYLKMDLENKLPSNLIEE